MSPAGAKTGTGGKPLDRFCTPAGAATPTECLREPRIVADTKPQITHDAQSWPRATDTAAT
eukprot:9702873-Alexandrium_andersonii.AAC.1